jgi:polar amino acid transport system substrate-binding protein
VVPFSKKYTTDVKVIVVRYGSRIKSANDLFEKDSYHKVGVQTGTTGDIYCSDDIEDSGLGVVERYNAGESAIAALLDGKIDCVVIDKEPAKAFVEKNNGLIILESTYAKEDYSIAIRKKNKKLKKKVDLALEELKEEGVIDKIVDEYIND